MVVDRDTKPDKIKPISGFMDKSAYNLSYRNNQRTVEAEISYYLCDDARALKDPAVG